MTNEGLWHGKMPPWWIIGSIIFSIVVLMLLLFFSNRPFKCSKIDEGFSCGFIHEPKFTYEKYFGYFYDWDEKMNNYCSFEEVHLGFSDDKVSLEARSTGRVKDRYGNLINRSWSYRGYQHGNNFALAYITEQNPTTGNGVYYLVQTNGEFAGFWIGSDWPSGRIIRCPYILTKTEKHGSEACEVRWPHVFSPRTACQEVVFQ